MCVGLAQKGSLFFLSSLQTIHLDFPTCSWKAQRCRYSLFDYRFAHLSENTHFSGCRKEVLSKKVSVRELSKAENLLKESLSLQVPACSHTNNIHGDLPSITIDNVFTLSQDRCLTIGKKKQQSFWCQGQARKVLSYFFFSLSELKGFSEDSSFTYRRGVPLPRLF